MVVSKKQIFNLMNTNGRRSDVINALKIYLEILQDLNISYPNEVWEKYPVSAKQIMFYGKALDASKDVFKIHKKYDSFIESIGDEYSKLLDKDKTWIQEKFDKYADVIDESIEQRSRHYTSNLVKFGFTNGDRQITGPGYSFLNNKVKRDELETLLPLGDTNIVLIRQLMKLRIFSEADENQKRTFYSPFLMALYILFRDEIIDKVDFSLIIQGISPYISDEIKNKIVDNTITTKDLIEYVTDIEVLIPDEIKNITTFTKKDIKNYFKTSKDSISVTEMNYSFYTKLKAFVENRNQDNLSKLAEDLENNNTYLKKAFGYGKSVFISGNRSEKYSLDAFIEENKDHQLLNAQDFNINFYKEYILSKNADGIKEYSDTTMRMFGASGLFKFKNLPELAFKKILEMLFNKYNLSDNIFGTVTEDEFNEYDVTNSCRLYQNLSILEILKYSKIDTEETINNILKQLKVENIDEAKSSLFLSKNSEFKAYIESTYPKQRVIELLKLFSDRNNDNKIKSEVNESATVPTIYEYVIAIAWYYISRCDYDLYESMNLTLNADFEPVIHAGGGAGDIVINYAKSVIMLEVTLMNKQAQKRGEWEPVLRHSLNLKAENIDKETITFFVADELDTNTINIWRAVAAATLESTSIHTTVDGVIIMPLTNLALMEFLQKNIYKNKIIQMTKASFAMVPKITDLNWHRDILERINPKE